VAGGVNVPVTSTWDPSGVRKAQADVGAFQRQADGMLGAIGKSFAGFGVGLAAGMGAGFIKDQIGQAIGAASDLYESQSKVNVVFGKSAEGISLWADTSATALLMTKQQALEATGTFGNLFQAFGIGQKQAAEWSQQLVQTAADLSSFNNMDPSVVLDKLRSGITGEQEAVKDLGIALTDQRLRQEAFNQGIYRGTGVLTANQKVQAAYALILRDTALAQGDVARTASGWANTSRALTAAIGNAQAEIGGGFLEGIQSTSAAMGGPDGMVALIGGVASNSATAAENVGKLATMVTYLGDKVQEVGGKQPGWLQWLFNTDHQIDWSWAGLGGQALAPLIRNYQIATDTADAYNIAAEKSRAITSSFADGEAQRLFDLAANQQPFQVIADGLGSVDTNAKKAKSSIDLLNGALDTLYGRNQSREEARLGLQSLRREGPGKSGSREVTVPGDKKVITDALGGRHVVQGTKKKTVQFSTEADARQFAVDYARQAGTYAGTFADPFKQAQVLQNAQSYIAKTVGGYVKNPKMFAAGLIGPNAAGFTRAWERPYAAGSVGGQQLVQNYNIDKVELNRGASWDQLVKEAERRAASTGGRFVAPTGARR